MYGLRNTADSTLVTQGRGREIAERFDALGMADREWHRITGIDRKTLNRAIEEVPGTRDSTYAAISMWLDKLEARTQRPVGNGDYVEFTVEGNFGVRAVVKGPVRDMAELERAVERLVREMRGTESQPEADDS